MRRSEALALLLPTLLVGAWFGTRGHSAPSTGPRGQDAATKVACVRYFLIPVERVCGRKVYWRNPDGSEVIVGTVDQLHGMPRPRYAKVDHGS